MTTYMLLELVRGIPTIGFLRLSLSPQPPQPPQPPQRRRRRQDLRTHRELLVVKDVVGVVPHVKNEDLRHVVAGGGIANIKNKDRRLVVALNANNDFSKSFIFCLSFL